MALVSCADCTASYPGDVAACPHCGSTSRGGGSVLATVILCCRTRGCRYEDVPRRVGLRLAAPGVLEAPTYLCGGCGGQLPWSREEADMAKIHADREPTYAPEPGPGPEAQISMGDGTATAATGGPVITGLPVEEPEASATAPPDYAALTVDQLRGLLAERDLPKTGTKAELVARLQEADAAEVAGTTQFSAIAEATVTHPDGTTS